jgi:hypothetical protein
MKANKPAICSKCMGFFYFVVQAEENLNICPKCLSYIEAEAQKPIYNIYDIQEIDVQEIEARRFHGRIDFANSGFGDQITICIYNSGNIAVGIDRWGFFVFKNREALKYHSYVAEKVAQREDVVKDLVGFFDKFFLALDKEKLNG